MGTSSARPANLERFIATETPATGAVASKISGAQQQLEAYCALPSDYHLVNGAAILDEGRRYVADNSNDDEIVTTVHRLFVAADRLHLSDAAVALGLQRAGVSTAPRQAITVDQPLAQGRPLDSGMSDDPVCTATGHFLEIETDLVMPAPLRVLGCTRTYSSRFLGPTSLGRGWYCWADAHLILEEGGADYLGPDGQAATFLLGNTGTLTNSGVEAGVESLGDGLRMVWRWASRFPGMVWEFGADGLLEVIHDPFGGMTTCRREGGRLVALEHQGGRRVELAWEDNRLVALAASDGRRVGYHYQGDLVGVDRPGGRQDYSVDDAGHILEVVDADRVTLVANTYDDDGRVLSQRSPFGRTTHYRYLAPHTVVVADPEGPSTLFRHDVGGRLIELHTANGTSSLRAFDECGNAITVVDFDGGRTDRAFDLTGSCVYERRADGSEHRWSYDDRGRVVRHVGANGGVTTYRYNGDQTWPSVVDEPLGRRTSYVSRDGLPTRMTDADGVTVTIDRDGDGQVTALTNDLGETATFTPHPTGAVTAVRLPSGAVWTYEVDGAGRTLAERSPLGHRRAFRWTAAGRLAATVAPDGTTTLVERGPHGEAEAIVQPDGAVTSQSWDTAGNVDSITGPTGSTWTFDYDGLGQLTSMMTPAAARWLMHWGDAGASEGVTDPLGLPWSTENDALGRSIAEDSPLGRRIEIERGTDGSPCLFRNEAGATLVAAHDALGQLIDIAKSDGRGLHWSWSPAGRPLAATLPDGSAWRWSYDEAGRPVLVTNPDGGSTTFAYDTDGRLVGSVNPTGGRTTFAWDADGRLFGIDRGGAHTRMVLDPNGRIVEAQEPDTGAFRCSYGANGNLAEVTDAFGNPTRLHQQWATGTLEVVDAKGATRRCQFDAEARPVAVTDPLGRRTEIERDACGRPAKVTGPDGQVTEVAWDPDGDLLSIARQGRPMVIVEADVAELTSRVTDAGEHTTEAAWDPLGRQRLTDADGRSTGIVYDDDGQTSAVTSPNGEVVTIGYDWLGRPTVIDHDLLGPIHARRDAAGELVALDGEGFSRRWTRDPWGRVVRYEERIGANVEEIIVERDPTGRVVAEHGARGTRRYHYDVAGQLIGFDTPGRTTTWIYDRCGRMETETVTDGSGAIVRRRRFDYDVADQLVRVTDGEAVTALSYDHAGRRTSERSPLGTVTYRWDGLGHLTGIERTAAPDGGHPGESTERRVVIDGRGTLRRLGDTPIDWLDDGPFGDIPLGIDERTIVGLPGLPVATVGDGTVEWLSTDWRGTVGAQYDPWGATAEPDDEVGLGYLGEVQMDGLLWLRNRIYDPSTHAFLSPDPQTGTIGCPGALTNPYTYANNDPLGWLDPAGLKPLSMAQAQAQMQSWKTSHLGEFVVGTLAVVGTVALIVATGGAAAVVVPAVAGAVLGGGSAVATDVIEHKPIDPMNIYMNVGVGGFLGAASGGGDASLFAKTADLVGAPRVLAPGAYGAAGSFAMNEAQHPGMVGPNLETAGVSGVTSGALAAVRINPEDIAGQHYSHATKEAQALYQNALLAPGKASVAGVVNHNLDKLLPNQMPVSPSPAPTGIPKSAYGEMTPQQLQGYLAANG